MTGKRKYPNSPNTHDTKLRKPNIDFKLWFFSFLFLYYFLYYSIQFKILGKTFAWNFKFNMQHIERNIADSIPGVEICRVTYSFSKYFDILKVKFKLRSYGILSNLSILLAASMSLLCCMVDTRNGCDSESSTKIKSNSQCLENNFNSYSVS